ncbi:MAG TPA: helix-turn-helix transcriptional regulator [Actinomycetes bacterium]|nr:helix-turn-helix transcriptional regulator [Actinomycetes bacterium]
MSAVGTLIQHWRKTRRLSQLALAAEAAVSTRHLCFIETGRASPSREMVLKLAAVLDVPLRERNTMLLAAGYAPVYRESTLDEPVLAAVRAALDAILRQQEPYPAVAMNRDWDIIHGNSAAARFFGFLLDGREPASSGNVLRMMFHPDGVRSHVSNWPDVAGALVARVHREAIGGVADERAQRLLAEVLAYPGVPASLRTVDPTVPLVPVIPVCFAKDGQRFEFFSTVTTLGTPQDVTVQELRIECFFPADEQTRAAAQRLEEMAVSRAEA